MIEINKSSYLDAVDGMYVFHAIEHDFADLLQRLVWAHGTDSIALDKNVATC